MVLFAPHLPERDDKSRECRSIDRRPAAPTESIKPLMIKTIQSLSRKLKKNDKYLIHACEKALISSTSKKRRCMLYGYGSEVNDYETRWKKMEHFPRGLMTKGNARNGSIR
ncbi:uncharacterized protein LOC122531642 [Frieseomelitta varia]|uniref:uncharacterized protein LOC122531642 n=1 Tax=Frieseomelitta varia TaxID=561572 RepID=UPI001CB69313|nr:uncharacterized protein LOC122531642 [Frieseomelitta varia]